MAAHQRIPGSTSTGSKRTAAFLGALPPDGFPRRLVRSEGAVVWDEEGRAYRDYVMGLGAVALGYAHSEVTRAANAAVAAGVTGPLPPAMEDELAERLSAAIPILERVRFLKTGAEAVAAAVRIARVITNRERVITCGYHGWLDWCQREPGVPAAVRGLAIPIVFNDVEGGCAAIADTEPAAVVIEPVIDGLPRPAWLAAIREAASRAGAVLVFDEIKSAFRLAIGGVTERFGVTPDLMVVGKALANGFPLAAVGGREDVMAACGRTWISSTAATESVSLAAAMATLRVFQDRAVPRHLSAVGGELRDGLQGLSRRHPGLAPEVVGPPEMCYLRYPEQESAWRVTRAAALRGVLWKPSAYNFVSLAHDADTIRDTLARLDEAMAEADHQASAAGKGTGGG